MKGIVSAHAIGCVQWCCLFLILFFLTLPLWGGSFVGVLKFVLEGLNSIGQPS